jgi:hypothetical protein
MPDIASTTLSIESSAQAGIALATKSNFDQEVDDEMRELCSVRIEL